MNEVAEQKIESEAEASFDGVELSVEAVALAQALAILKRSGPEIVADKSLKRVTLEANPESQRLLMRADGAPGTLTSAVTGTCGGDVVSTDLEKLQAIAEICKPGETAIIRASKEDARANRMRITTEKGKFVLPLLRGGKNIAERPQGSVTTFEVYLDRFRAALNHVRHAAPYDDSRHYLNGVNLNMDSTGLCLLTATDTYRVAIEAIPGPMNMDSDRSAIIPRATVDALAHLLASREAETVRVGIGKSSAWISAPAEKDLPLFHLALNLVDGAYADVAKVLPTVEPIGVIRGDKSVFSQITKLCEVFTTRTAYYLRLKSDEGRVLAEFGEDQQQLELALACEGTVDVGLSNKYLTEALSALGDGEVTLMQYAMGNRPRPVKMVGESDGDLVEYIMPVKS